MDIYKEYDLAYYVLAIEKKLSGKTLWFSWLFTQS